MNVYRLFLLLSLVMTTLLGNAQDTLRVQTFTFDDITKRRGWFQFPDDEQSYRKILMNHKLKCSSQTQQDNFPCGEWDYTTLTDIYTYDNVSTPYFILGTDYQDTIRYSLEPIYDYYQSYQLSPMYTSIVDETAFELSDGMGSAESPLRADRLNNRTQYLFTADELTDIGLSAGPIHRISVFVESIDGEGIDYLRIAMKNTQAVQLDDSNVDSEGFIEVYLLNTPIEETGIEMFDLYQAFEWDGSSNVIVEISSDKPTADTDGAVVSASDVDLDLGLVSTRQERYLDFEGDRYVEIPSAAFENVDQEITISFWAYGDEESLPFNTWVLEGVDSLNRRVINVHLPWSNGRVYWDAGNANTSNYDRIDLAVDPQDYRGRWTHWAFTKNATSGEMRIYMDGEEIHNGSGKTRSMAGVQRFKLGGRGDRQFEGNYDGHIDEFQIWSKELSQSEIEEYMMRSADEQHPQYDFLEAAYDCNGTGPILTDYSQAGLDAQLIGMPNRTTMKAKDIFLNMANSGARPDLTFYRGEYESTMDTVLAVLPVPHGMSSVIETLPYIDQDVAGMSYEYIDTNFVYLSAPSLTYAPDGSIIDEVSLGSELYFANLFKENRHQLQNYVTPYGIGLSLGPDGFRWQYEVTDYRDLFKGWVEIRAGNQQELIDLEFEFIEGTPPREVLEMETIWLGNYSHAAIADDLVLPAVDRTMRTDASSFGLRTRTTGHWFGGVLNCAEFCPKNFNIQIDGVEQFEWLNWKECADNPVISQGGTWIYDRAGWCPGTFADTYDHDITPYVTPGGTHSIDFGMQPYVTNGGEGNYWTTLQFFQYGDYSHQYDVEVIDIISPNTWEYHNRYNPICKDPEIEIRNVGSETVTSMDITYWVTGGQPITYQWTGELAFNEKERVILPVADQGFWAYNGETKFHVQVSNPNGQADEYADNDVMSSDFEYPDLHSEPFYIWFRSNNFPNENSYAVYDEMGNTVFERTSFSPNTQYKDTLYLPDGCYSIRLNDLGHDGLSFFANNDGTGYFRLRYVSGSVIEYFDGDFGSFINYQFQMDTEVGLSENLDEELIQVHPNPSSGQFTLRIDMYEGSILDLEILDSRGKQVYTESGQLMNDRMRKEIDLSNLSDGIYFARILIDGRQIIRKLIKN